MGKTEFQLDSCLDEIDKQLSKMIEQEYPQKFKELVYKLAQELMGKVVELTPNDTGDLQRGWTIGKVVKKGDEYYIEVFNNLDYAEHVEHGHRTRGGKKFVPGAHMMKISLTELNARLPAYLSQWIHEFISVNNL